MAERQGGYAGNWPQTSPFFTSTATLSCLDVLHMGVVGFGTGPYRELKQFTTGVRDGFYRDLRRAPTVN